MEIVAAVLLTLLFWALLVAFTALAWWICLILALIVAVLGVYVGPELFN